MKAVLWTNYGAPDVLQLQDVEMPTPNVDEVLIKIRATTVTAAESNMRQGKPVWGRILLGLATPRKRFRIMGLEFAGEIEAVGNHVKRFKQGDSVYGFTGFKLGAYAEYICLPEKASLSVKPANLSFDEAAACVDGASTALFFLKNKANIQPGQKLLVIGASGSIGTYAVQLAKYFGAEVTGVCSTANLELVKVLGADKVIDYTQEDFSKNGETYDVIFDTVGKSTFSQCRGSLKRSGCYLPTTGLQNNFWALWTRLTGGKRVLSGMSVEKNGALAFLKGLIEAGKLRPVIDARYPLEQIVEAHRYVDSGRKRGNVIITVA